MRLVALVLAALALTACSDHKTTLKVSAATSLKAALTGYAAGFDRADVALSFAGSDQLAAQIREGARPDVFASANTMLPDALHRAGLVQKPVVFAANRLVLAVPAGATKVRSLADLERRGLKLAVAAPGVPAGDYAQQVLARLGPRATASVRSREPDVAGVVGKIAQGAVDAGFVYATDVKASGGRLKEIALPAGIAPQVRYAAAVVRDGEQARAFVGGLARAPALRHAGFERP